MTAPLGQALLSRILLPRPGEPLDVRSLYLEESATNATRVQALSRTSAHIGAESEASFGTYFNAFPASYWRRWTTLDAVVLRLELTGHGRADVYRSKADGSRIHVEGREFVDGQGDLEFLVDLGPFEDGGWIWFDITSETEVVLDAGGWYAPVEAPGEGRVTVGIPTFNRPGDAVAALEALASDPLVLSVIDAVIMPDQGTKKVIDAPGYPEAAAALGERLTIYPQPNLGGSGGYSRIMYEALARTTSPHVLYMDDDIAIEPDSILRALAMSRFAKTPMFVGGQMLNLQERSHLHSMGEVIDRAKVMWTGAPNTEYDHDFSKYPLSDRDNSKSLHRRIDVDGNGWWMCMIPRAAAEAIGLPMPLFIKWDDWEYALRARAAGYPTATVPGIAIWHMAWSDKDDAIDWQAYFHLRNRLVVAALHFPGSISGLVRDTYKATAKHLLSLEYSTVAIQIKAIEDFLAGPEYLASLLPTALGEVAALRKQYPDAVVLPSATALPRPSGDGVGAVGQPGNPIAKVARLLKGLVQQVKPTSPQHLQTPQLNVATMDARWFLLSQVDGVTVTTADGRGVVYRQRDREKAAALAKRAYEVRRDLLARFDDVAAQYRADAEHLASPQRWAQVFGIENDSGATDVAS